jgi:hypothetical protein
MAAAIFWISAALPALRRKFILKFLPNFRPKRRNAMANAAPTQTDGTRRATADDLAEDSMTSDVEKLLPPARHERWFDLCFRLIILALAAFWLLAPPAGGAEPLATVKAAATTR